jgi:hypothetical protein
MTGVSNVAGISVGIGTTTPTESLTIQTPNTNSFAGIKVANYCKFARNTDPLRGDFASNSDPS